MYYVDGVIKKSLAEKKGIVKGDVITYINNEEVTDGLMYGYLICSPSVIIELISPNGDKKQIKINNDYEDIGVINNRPMIENPKNCHNKCIFCFIDQLPANMRKPLYFKDDDTRLSFLTGNYVTFTNMTDEEFENVIKMRLSPVNVSVHTTNDELRVLMLKNKKAVGIKKKIERLISENITVNAQIVLCKNFNDKENLKNTLKDLYDLEVDSVSVVPMGQTKYRDGLCQVEVFSKEDCIETINIINKFGDIAKEERGVRFAYPADEFFLNAQIPIPDASYYDDFVQIENGVGMLSSFIDEFDLDNFQKKGRKINNKTVATSYGAYDTIKELVRRFNDKYDSDIKVERIKNNFFGEKITVAGLLTGCDITQQLKGENIETLLLPRNVFRSEGDLTLDDMTITDIENKLSCKVVLCENSGQTFLEELYR